MSDEIQDQFVDSIYLNDVQKARGILKTRPELLHVQSVGSWLHIAAGKNYLELAKMLLEHGLDVNGIKNNSYITPLHKAIYGRHLDMANWLLDNGADIEGCIIPKGGDDNEPTPLISAIIEGNLEMVKLLIGRGARYNDDLDHFYGSEHSVALKCARQWGHKDIEEYLLIKMFEPLSDEERMQNAVEIRQHLAKCFSEPLERELYPMVGTANILIVPPAKDCMILSTSGMSDDPLAVGYGYETFRYVELLFFLPPVWPIGEDVLDDRENFWPFELLMRLADYPHEKNIALGNPYTIVSNSDMPGFEIPGTDFAGALILCERGDYCRLHTSSGRLINFYSVAPLYQEEIDMITANNSVSEFIKRMKEADISRIFDIKRPNLG